MQPQFSIRPFAPGDTPGVIALILPIQREEYGIAITAQDQPDLSDIPGFYQQGGGAFLVAQAGDSIMGTIAMKAFGPGQMALRKMFVAAPWRGRDRGVAQALLDRLLHLARAGGVTQVMLGTNDRFRAAHRFYERNGFIPVDADDLPTAFPRMAVDNHFYSLRLD